LLHDIDWKKYPECPLVSTTINQLFSKSSVEIKDKLIKVYGSNLLEFAEKFGNDNEIIARCIETNILPK